MYILDVSSIDKKADIHNGWQAIKQITWTNLPVHGINIKYIHQTVNTKSINISKHTAVSTYWPISSWHDGLNLFEEYVDRVLHASGIHCKRTKDVSQHVFLIGPQLTQMMPHFMWIQYCLFSVRSLLILRLIIISFTRVFCTRFFSTLHTTNHN